MTEIVVQPNPYGVQGAASVRAEPLPGGVRWLEPTANCASGDGSCVAHVTVTTPVQPLSVLGASGPAVSALSADAERGRRLQALAGSLTSEQAQDLRDAVEQAFEAPEDEP